VGWKSWAEIVAEFLKAKNDPPALKTWVNTVLGETWEEEYSIKVGAEGLMARVETWNLLICQPKVLMLTAGVDVQDNRLEATVMGWGEGDESWVVNHSVIHGDPERPEVWKQLDDLLAVQYTHAAGADHTMKVMAAAVDSGAHTQAVYDYARRRRGFVIPIKGMSESGKPVLGKPTKQDVNHKGAVVKGGVELFPVGSDTGKAVIYGRFKITEQGPRYIHFPQDLTEDYFKQLTAETQIVQYQHGFAKKKWVKSSGARNEALDCMVYALAALEYVKTKYNRLTLWKQLAALLPKPEPEAEAEIENTADEPKVEEQPEPKLPPRATTARAKIPTRRGGNSWMKGWR
jgi:phage terminase large subunit GpA-like protein